MTSAAFSLRRLVPVSVVKLLRNTVFLYTTLLPTVAATIYFGLIASDVYISESSFVVRGQNTQSSSPLNLLFKGGDFSSAQDDSYAVQAFILSRDAIKSLDDELHIKKSYADKNVDIFSRFAGLDGDESFESFYPYYQKKVTVQIDPTSSITTLDSRAFTPEDAYAINERLVELAEKLVNKLNDRAWQDLIALATQEVAEAEKRSKAAAVALAKYRNQKGVIDPERQSDIPLQQVARLQDELVTTRAQILTLEKLAKDNPQLPVLRQRAGLLEQEIQQENSQIAGSERSLAAKAADFQRLSLDKEVSDKMLASALASLEQAHTEAQRKQLYLERIAQPGHPDEAMEPKRLRAVLATFAVGLILCGIVTILLAGVREHLD